MTSAAVAHVIDAPSQLCQSDQSLLGLAIRARATRGRMRALFPADLCSDTAWDMMLEVFITQLQRRNVCVKELILVSGSSSSSALRRIDRLEDGGLIRRRLDRDDHRRTTVQLTERGHTAMVLMLEQFLCPTATRHAVPPAGPKSFFPQRTVDRGGDASAR
jgi:hypothetical protein